GERIGDLRGAIVRLAGQMEKHQLARSKATNALVYPAVLIAATSATVALMMLVVLPRFEELLNEAGVTLPWLTVAMLRGSHVIRQYWPLILVSLVGLVLLLGVINRRQSNRRRLHGALLSFPLINVLYRNLIGFRISRLTGTLVEGGVPLLVAVQATRDAHAA